MKKSGLLFILFASLVYSNSDAMLASCAKRLAQRFSSCGISTRSFSAEVRGIDCWLTRWNNHPFVQMNPHTFARVKLLSSPGGLEYVCSRELQEDIKHVVSLDRRLTEISLEHSSCDICKCSHCQLCKDAKQLSLFLKNLGIAIVEEAANRI